MGSSDADGTKVGPVSLTHTSHTCTRIAHNGDTLSDSFGLCTRWKRFPISRDSAHAFVHLFAPSLSFLCFFLPVVPDIVSNTDGYNDNGNENGSGNVALGKSQILVRIINDLEDSTTAASISGLIGRRRGRRRRIATPDGIF